MESAKVTIGLRKAKKKQVKDEVDRLKQAEKKKRRLEKALATSAAIRSELEKKKLKKKEELDRLDEEGAAIAEAVALHVLLDEDSDDSRNVMLKKDVGLNSWDHAIDVGIIVGRRPSLLPLPYQKESMHSLENTGIVSDAYRFGLKLTHWRNSNIMVSSATLGWDFNPECFGEGQWSSLDLSANHLAAQAVSSLKIADDSQVEDYVFKQML